jgi:hypothetical protein
MQCPSAPLHTLNHILVRMKSIFSPNGSNAYILFSGQAELDLTFLLQYDFSQLCSNKQTKTIETMSDHYVKNTKILSVKTY